MTGRSGSISNFFKLVKISRNETIWLTFQRGGMIGTIIRQNRNCVFSIYIYHGDTEITEDTEARYDRGEMEVEPVLEKADRHYPFEQVFISGKYR